LGIVALLAKHNLIKFNKFWKWSEAYSGDSGNRGSSPVGQE